MPRILGIMPSSRRQQIIAWAYHFTTSASWRKTLVSKDWCREHRDRETPGGSHHQTLQEQREMSEAAFLPLRGRSRLYLYTSKLRSELSNRSVDREESVCLPSEPLFRHLWINSSTMPVKSCPLYGVRIIGDPIVWLSELTKQRGYIALSIESLQTITVS